MVLQCVLLLQFLEYYSSLNSVINACFFKSSVSITAHLKSSVVPCLKKQSINSEARVIHSYVIQSRGRTRGGSQQSNTIIANTF